MSYDASKAFHLSHRQKEKEKSVPYVHILQLGTNHTRLPPCSPLLVHTSLSKPPPLL